ncbi:small subunit ribosomal protein S5 [Paragonimus westermani]|uniref:Small ribosomal subunit protein uS5m n=1 Tax=Paragonimus westermani TaxID=34504 RepID=A0A5J4N4W0_9TREM|nr:small subunit ribosomal protein S5 [Paragonimus westermani]
MLLLTTLTPSCQIQLPSHLPNPISFNYSASPMTDIDNLVSVSPTCHHSASVLPRFLLGPRMRNNIGAFNVRTLKQVGQQTALTRTLDSLNVDVCCISEARIQANPRDLIPRNAVLQVLIDPMIILNALRITASHLTCGLCWESLSKATSFTGRPLLNQLIRSAHFNPPTYRLSKNAYSPLLNQVRSSTIFTSLPADQLWEGVTGPKGGTKKRARGKRRVARPKVDLNRGQLLGMRKANMEWPGLNAPLLDRNRINTIKAKEIRNKSAVKKKRMKLPSLLRGWTGSRLGGQSVGPPTPEYPDFDTRVIEMKAVATMTATVGRYRRFSVLVATGNGRGLCGIGKAKAITLPAAVRQAKQRASQNLVSFDLKDNRTLWHIGHVGLNNCWN